jgi:hypothetical protein
MVFFQNGIRIKVLQLEWRWESAKTQICTHQNLYFQGGSLPGGLRTKTTEKVGARRLWIFLERPQRSNQPLVLCEVFGRCRLPASERIITQALVQRAAFY